MADTHTGLSHDLLDEPLLGIEDDVGRREKVTLPGLLARLSQGMPTSLTAVQAHQQHAVHAFLVQLAALALARADETELAHDETEWRALLLGATRKDGAGAEAFTLVVADLSKPAFLQPPVPEGTLTALKIGLFSDLDVLVTAKNHDVKIDRLAAPMLEDWVLSLISLQTMQGYLGPGNYGIARMNGGRSSRPCVTFASEQGTAARFLRDTQALLRDRALLIERFGFGQKAEIGLVWCKPWDGTTQLTLGELDPFFIEICRRVRLCASGDRSVVAYRGSSRGTRIGPKELIGNTGDPWTPVTRDEGQSLTMGEAGFHYGRVQELMFGQWRLGAAGEPSKDGSDRLWCGQVLVRNDRGTAGYQERWVPVPGKVRLSFSEPTAREKLRERSKAWVQLAADTRLKVLKPALLTLLQGAPEKLKFDDDRANSYLRRFDAALDDEFFSLLFEHADATPEAADTLFQKKLGALAEAELRRAVESLPVPSARRWRAEAKADRVFFGASRKLFKLAFPPPAAASAQGETL